MALLQIFCHPTVTYCRFLCYIAHFSPQNDKKRRNFSVTSHMRIITENTTKRCRLHSRDNAIREFVCEHPMSLRHHLSCMTTSHPISSYKKTTFSPRKRFSSPIPSKIRQPSDFVLSRDEKYGGCHICVKVRFSYLVF